MSRFENMGTLNVKASLEDAKRLVKLVLQAQHIEIVQERPDSLVGKQGSQVITRALGGWFVNPDKLPKRVEMRVVPQGDLVRVDITTVETLGLGHFGPRLRKRYALSASALRAEIALAFGEKVLV